MNRPTAHSLRWPARPQQEIIQLNAALRYADEKLSTAIYSLAGSNRPLRERLAPALRELLITQSEALPQDIADRFRALLNRTNHVTAQGDEGTTVATLATMSPDQLTEVAHDYVDLTFDVRRRAVAEQ